MKQREVTTKNNTIWTCVQALAGVEGKTAEKAKQLLESNGNKIAVICTPSGGEQSLRLMLPTHWYEQLSDEDLISAIEEHSNNGAR